MGEPTVRQPGLLLGRGRLPDDAIRRRPVRRCDDGIAETAVTRAERELLLTPVTAATKGAPPLGLGWRIDADKKGRRRWHHAGATPGGCYLLAVYPDQRLSVALAGNVMTMKMNVLQAASDIVDGFAG